MFVVAETGLPGCFEITHRKVNDLRGSFTKLFHEDVFLEKGIKFHLAEEYVTCSAEGVFRGMHFQVPPSGIDKIVTCLQGEVEDFVMDLRRGSPTYGRHVKFKLSGDEPKSIFVPVGFAHGFLVTKGTAVIHYKVSGVYDAACDTGILFSSLPFAKGFGDVIISERDKTFPAFEDFETPFNNL